jgi:hypothetical protein
MIITGKLPTKDVITKVLNFDTDGAGAVKPCLETAMSDDMVPQYFEQQEITFQHLLRRVMAGELSPIALYMGLTRMTVKDLAARVRLRQSVVEKHMTLSGFTTARVDQLEAYALQFDVCVSDFFQVMILDGDVKIAEVKKHFGRLLQTVRIAPAPSASGGEGHTR